MHAGQRLLILGTPGTEKTLLFRALAGLWPWGSGTVRRPGGETIHYMPRGTPYLPRGTLAEALSYAMEPSSYPKEAMVAALASVGLQRLEPLLDKTGRWERELSIDEQLLLGFARVVLQAPPWLVMDEAFGAFDDDTLERIIDVLNGRARAHGHRPHRLGRRGARPAVHAGGASGQGAGRRARGPARRSHHRSAWLVRVALLLLLVLALPAWAWAQDFGFRPPRDPDDVAAVDVMRDLAQRIVPVYKDADTDGFLANVTALQIVSGAYGAAYDSNRALRRRHRGKPFDGLSQRAVLDGIYARARAIEAKERLSFAQAYARSFQELVPPLDNAQAAAVMSAARSPAGGVPRAGAAGLRSLAREGQPPAGRRRGARAHLARVRVASQLRRAAARADRGGKPQPLRRRADVRIPVRGGAVIHATRGPARPREGHLADAAALHTRSRPRTTRSAVPSRATSASRHTCAGARPTARAPCGRSCATAKTPRPSSTGSPGSRGATAASPCSATATPATPPGPPRAEKPAALKAIATIAPMAPGIDFPMAGQIYRNAMVRWEQEHAAGGAPRAEPTADADAKWRALDARWYRGDRPYWDVDRVLLGNCSKLIRTWLTHPSHDLYWQKFLPTAEQFAQIDIPVLTIAGYYGAEAGALYFHHEHRRNRPQADTTLLLGPYDAASIRLGTAPTLRGYTLDSVARVDLPELRYQWLDHVFKGAKKPSLLQDRVNYQVMGANQWRHVPTLDSTERTPAAPVPRHPQARRPAPSVDFAVRRRWQRATRGRSRRSQ